MKKATLSLKECREYFAKGITEPQSGKELTEADVADRDALQEWAHRSFGIVLMTSTNQATDPAEDLIEVTYF
ncbi:hypothetical protein [Lacticaseibacillus jixiensis]|uniref:hypothetical protein n=1 Tax=Lacticaseibacillus jixiensis TaxID=3231926 RepID=UPI0036F20147